MGMASVSQLASEVNDGDVVSIGGKTLHRVPMAFVRALARAETEDLTLLGLTHSMDGDLLCGTGQVSDIHFGYVGFEAYGLAPNFKEGVENGDISPREGTCYTVTSMLRGAKQNVPFMPIPGLYGSEIPEANSDNFTKVESPFSGEEGYAVRTITPDIAVVHANEADEEGNARFDGADLTEGLLARAADRVFVTAERIVDTETFTETPKKTDIPGFLVDEVVEVPNGAHPCSCPGEYPIDDEHVTEYLELSSAGEFDTYLERYLGESEAEYQELALGEVSESVLA